MGQSFERKFGLDNKDMVRAAMAAPMLERDHELDLARRWRDHHDQAALGVLTRSYLRLVISMSARFRNYGLAHNDLVQEGVVGLMEAASRFDPSRDVRFSTYAMWWIRAAMQDYVLRNWSIVRTGTTAAHKSLFFNLRRVRAQIAGEYDGRMTPDVVRSVAEKLGVRVSDVELMEARLSAGDRSLELTIGDDGDGTWLDLLVCDAPRPDEALEDLNDGVVRTDLMNAALQTLSPRERTIIHERRLTEAAATLQTLAIKLGISKERVRQIEANALAKLKSALLARVRDPIAVGLVGA